MLSVVRQESRNGQTVRIGLISMMTAFLLLGCVICCKQTVGKMALFIKFRACVTAQTHFEPTTSTISEFPCTTRTWKGDHGSPQSKMVDPEIFKPWRKDACPYATPIQFPRNSALSDKLSTISQELTTGQPPQDGCRGSSLNASKVVGGSGGFDITGDDRDNVDCAERDVEISSSPIPSDSNTSGWVLMDWRIISLAKNDSSLPSCPAISSCLGGRDLDASMITIFILFIVSCCYIYMLAQHAIDRKKGQHQYSIQAAHWCAGARYFFPHHCSRTRTPSRSSNVNGYVVIVCTTVFWSTFICSIFAARASQDNEWKAPSIVHLQAMDGPLSPDMRWLILGCCVRTHCVCFPFLDCLAQGLTYLSKIIVQNWGNICHVFDVLVIPGARTFAVKFCLPVQVLLLDCIEGLYRRCFRPVFMTILLPIISILSFAHWVTHVAMPSTIVIISLITGDLARGLRSILPRISLQRLGRIQDFFTIFVHFVPFCTKEQCATTGFVVSEKYISTAAWNLVFWTRQQIRAGAKLRMARKDILVSCALISILSCNFNVLSGGVSGNTGVRTCSYLVILSLRFRKTVVTSVAAYSQRVVDTLALSRFVAKSQLHQLYYILDNQNLAFEVRLRIETEILRIETEIHRLPLGEIYFFEAGGGDQCTSLWHGRKASGTQCQKLANNLEQEGAEVVKCKADGNCFYHAVKECLIHSKGTHRSFGKDIDIVRCGRSSQIDSGIIWRKTRTNTLPNSNITWKIRGHQPKII